MRNFKIFLTAISAIGVVAFSGCGNTGLVEDDFSDAAATGTDAGGGSDASTGVDAQTADNGCVCPEPLDHDGDGYCAGYAVVSASCPKGGNDCDDNDIQSYPGAPELCDGKDNNCNGQVDETFHQIGSTCNDGKGICAIAGVLECSKDKLSAVCSTDLNGSKCPAQSTEDCGANGTGNGLDDNCNGQTDENCGTQTGGGDNWLQINCLDSADRLMTIEWSTVDEPDGPYWKHQYDAEGYGVSVTSHFPDPPVVSGQVLCFLVNYTYVGQEDWACSDNHPKGQERDPNIESGALHIFGTTHVFSPNDFIVTQAKNGCYLKICLAF